MNDARSKCCAIMFLIIVLSLSLGVLTGCGGSQITAAGTPVPIPTPTPAASAPSITAISPATAQAGSAGFTLTVNGTGFISSSVVSFGSTSLTTAFVSAIQLTASVPASVLLNASTVQVAVTNSGNLISNKMAFVVSNAPQLSISSLSPSSVVAGSAGFTLTVNGSGFTSTAVVTFNGASLTTTFVSAAQLTALVPASAIVNPGNATVKVVDGSLSSGPATFRILSNQFPAVLSVSFNDPTTFGDSFSNVPVSDSQGRFVAFTSQASNLIPNYTNNGPTDVFVRDTCNGGPNSCAPSTKLVSLDAAGQQCVVNNGSVFPSISGDGRYVAFQTDNCFPGITTANPQIALRDTCNSVSGPISNCTPSTTLISANTSGQPSNGKNTVPGISRNGRYIVWQSSSGDLLSTSVAFVLFAEQVYLRDTCNSSSGPINGCTPHTIIVSATGANNTPSTGADFNAGDDRAPAVSNNGIVVFNSTADNLIANPAMLAGSGPNAVFRADCSGGVNLCSLSLVTIVPGSGSSTTGKLVSSHIPTISPDGRFIAFVSKGENPDGSLLVSTPPPNLPPASQQLPAEQAMIFDSCLDTNGAVQGCAPSFHYASLDNSGKLDLDTSTKAHVIQPTLSDDGRFVSFGASLNLSPSYPGHGAVSAGFEAYVRDTCAGSQPPASCTPSTALVSVDGQGVAAGNIEISNMSGDGHYVVFDSQLQDPANTSTALPLRQIIMVQTTY